MNAIAEQNLKTRYLLNPCRGLVIGMSEHGIGYHTSWIMGRSANSQNRRYLNNDSVVWTEAIDKSKLKNPELIIYEAMVQSWDYHIVGNGLQTRKLFQLQDDGAVEDRFRKSLAPWHCEPDPPNFTARITGVQVRDSSQAYISVIRRDTDLHQVWTSTIIRHGLKPEHFDSTDAFNNRVGDLSCLNWKAFPSIHSHFELKLEPGFGYSVTTYAPNNPQELAPFEGEPFLVPMPNSIDGVLEMFWNRLEPEWRVAIAAKEIPREGPSRIKVHNRF